RVVMLPVDTQVLGPGSYNSALARKLPKLSLPPATRTLPLASSVAVKPMRSMLMLPVAVHMPAVCAVAVVADIPVFKTGFPNESVADLLHPTTARRRLIEQRIKPIKTRRLKKADREKEPFSIAIYLKVVRANPDVSRISPAERG